MRFIFVALLLMLTGMFVCAQQQNVLALSKNAYVMKITDPEKQLVTFAPLLSKIDDLITTIDTTRDTKTPRISTMLKEKLSFLTRCPGVDGKGDFWVTFMPSTTPVTPQTLTPGTNPIAAMFAGATVNLLIPLTDAKLYQAAVAADKTSIFAKSQVFDRYAVVNPTDDPKAPKYTGVAIDLVLTSKRDIVFIGQTALAPNPAIPDAMKNSPGMVYVMNMMEEMKSNIGRSETGLTMEDGALLTESYAIPVKNSVLSKSVANNTPSNMAVEFAGYLPENLSVCVAGGPIFAGIPSAAKGFGSMFGALGSGLMVPDDQLQRLLQAIENFGDQCSKGRVLGITAPAGNAPGNVNMLAVYQIDDPSIATASLYNLVKEFGGFKKAVMGGMVDTNLKIFYKSSAERINDMPVDKLNFIINLNPPQATDKNAVQDPTKIISIEMYVGYTKNKMLLALGDGSLTQLKDMLTRVQNKMTTFTDGQRFQTAKSMLPATTYMFAILSLPDLCKSMINLAPIPLVDKTNGLKFLSVFPTLRKTITVFEECREGKLYSEFRMPEEQIDFVFSLIKGIALQAAAKKPGV